MKKMRFLALLVAAALLLSGCNLIKVNPERDGAQIVAVVGGENITKKEVYDAAGLTWDQKVEAWDIDSVNNTKKQMLDSLVQEKVVLQKAKADGYYNFTADEQKQIDDYVATLTQSTYDEALKKYQEDAKTDPSIKPEERAAADVDAYLATLGYTRDKLKQNKADSTAYNKLQKSVTDPISPAETDVKSAYDTQLSQQKTALDADATQLETADSNGAMILYYPADGYVRARHILIALPDDIVTQISQLRKDNKNTDADAKRDEELKKIVDKANEALGKAKAASGDLTKLDALIKEYGEDPGMESRTDGYLVGKDFTQLAPQFRDTALTQTAVGIPSVLVATDFGYHIIWLTEKIQKGDVPYESVKAKLTESVKANQQSTAWSNAVSGWVSDAGTKIKKYEGRLTN